MSSNVTSDLNEESAKLTVQSAPVITFVSDTTLKQQVSAPSYLFSLKENDAPPFRIPSKEPQPKLLKDTFLTEEEAIEMIAASASEIDGLKKYLVKKLVEKKFLVNYAVIERNFLMSFFLEVIDYSARHDFDAKKLSSLLTLYANTHLYFKWYYWQNPAAVWLYFKENLIRLSVEDSPDGQEIFEPQEAYNILTHFHTIYMTNLPLIHIQTFGAHRLKFSWPFKRK